MDELREGSYAGAMDLSKTFDQDETFDKVAHRCEPKSSGVQHLSIGERCRYCGAIIRKPRE